MSILELVMKILELLSNIAVAYIAVRAFFYTKKEYEAHREREKAETLAKFNERYSNDKNIEKFIKYLMQKDYDLKRPIGKDKCIECNNSKPQGKMNYSSMEEENNVDLIYQKEMFMRFFEELQIAIKAKSLDKEIAYDLFAYYALEENSRRNKEKENCWHLFEEFIEDMKAVKKSKTKMEK